MTYEEIIEAQNYIVENWGELGKEVIAACFRENPYNKPLKQFLDHCVTCGGNWGGMLLSGIKELYPKVYELIPDDMGIFAFTCIIYTLRLLGVDTSE